ncbi:MAG TPA: stage V sporulation protein AC [Firmicutes bacterium]|nr:stage V sporulation protein AC [Bacillota bacterium]
MSAQKKIKLTLPQQEYQAFVKKREPKRPVLKNSLKAFLVGCVICIIGQVVKWFFMTFFGFTETAAADPTIATMIILAVILTALGVYDHIAQFGGSGSIIPITGFANTLTAAALDHRSEGFVLGVGGNMFKIAGPVITYGVFSAFAIGIIVVVLNMLGGI